MRGHDLSLAYDIIRGGALSQTIKPRESSTPTKGLMGGMGTPQGPAGEQNPDPDPDPNPDP